MSLTPFVHSLLQRVNIVEVIGSVVPLKRAGKNYQACCPFHQEKTPSFNVNVDRQFFYCFGCGVGGDVINFIMRQQNLSFIEAVENLAQQVGMTMPRQQGVRQDDRQKLLLELMQQASALYRQQLQGAPHAIRYLQQRGVSSEIAKAYGLGYATADWQGLKGKLSEPLGNYEGTAVVDCGLVRQADNGRRYDWFRDRVVFPITNARGHVVGFGARTLGTEEPKYLNSPQTILFEKGQELYGLLQARGAIAKSQTIVVVEGYMDVVALAQHGVGESVATLGTATSEAQVRRLLQLAPRLIFCFDGDNAGRKAAWKALEVALPVLTDMIQIGFVFLPQGEDPDSFVRQKGAEAFRALMNNALPLSAYLQQKLAGEQDLSFAEGRAQLLARAQPLVARIQNAPSLRLQLANAFAQQCGLQLEELQNLWKWSRSSKSTRTPVGSQHRIVRAAPKINALALEDVMLQQLLQRPARAQGLVLEDMDIDSTQELGAAIYALVDAVEVGDLSPSAGLVVTLDFFRQSPHFHTIEKKLGSLLHEEEGDGDKMFIDTLHHLQRRKLDRKIEEMQRLIHGKKISSHESVTLLQQLLEEKRRLKIAE